MHPCRCCPNILLHRSCRPSRGHSASALRSLHNPTTCCSSENPTLFVFGLGYTATGLANHLQKRGWDVSGTCRESDKQRALAARGLRCYDFDPDNEPGLSAQGVQALQRATHVLSSVPPVGDFDNDPVLQCETEHLAALAGGVQWLGYLSSSSVYGDHHGDWVDEGSELRAVDGKGAARVAAEKAWLELHAAYALPVHIFRLGGIYGPSRSALSAVQAQVQHQTVSQSRRGRQRFTARCHVADIVQVLVASMLSPQPGAIYNISDDDPSPRSQVMAYARSLLGVQSPQDLGKTLQQNAGSRTKDLPSVAGASWSLPEKRVSNAKIKDELGVQLLYPTYREGLQAIVKGIMSPFD